MVKRLVVGILLVIAALSSQNDKVKTVVEVLIEVVKGIPDEVFSNGRE